MSILNDISYGQGIYWGVNPVGMPQQAQRRGASRSSYGGRGRSSGGTKGNDPILLPGYQNSRKDYDSAIQQINNEERRYIMENHVMPNDLSGDSEHAKYIHQLQAKKQQLLFFKKRQDLAEKDAEKVTIEFEDYITNLSKTGNHKSIAVDENGMPKYGMTVIQDAVDIKQNKAKYYIDPRTGETTILDPRSMIAANATTNAKENTPIAIMDNVIKKDVIGDYKDTYGQFIDKNGNVIHIVSSNYKGAEQNLYIDENGKKHMAIVYDKIMMHTNLNRLTIAEKELYRGLTPEQKAQFNSQFFSRGEGSFDDILASQRKALEPLQDKLKAVLKEHVGSSNEAQAAHDKRVKEAQDALKEQEFAHNNSLKVNIIKGVLLENKNTFYSHITKDDEGNIVYRKKDRDGKMTEFFIFRKDELKQSGKEDIRDYSVDELRNEFLYKDRVYDGKTTSFANIIHSAQEQFTAYMLSENIRKKIEYERSVLPVEKAIGVDGGGSGGGRSHSYKVGFFQGDQWKSSETVMRKYTSSYFDPMLNSFNNRIGDTLAKVIPVSEKNYYTPELNNKWGGVNLIATGPSGDVFVNNGIRVNKSYLEKVSLGDHVAYLPKHIINADGEDLGVKEYTFDEWSKRNGGYIGEAETKAMKDIDYFKKVFRIGKTAKPDDIKKEWEEFQNLVLNNDKSEAQQARLGDFQKQLYAHSSKAELIPQVEMEARIPIKTLNGKGDAVINDPEITIKKPLKEDERKELYKKIGFKANIEEDDVKKYINILETGRDDRKSDAIVNPMSGYVSTKKIDTNKTDLTEEQKQEQLIKYIVEKKKYSEAQAKKVVEKLITAKKKVLPYNWVNETMKYSEMDDKQKQLYFGDIHYDSRGNSYYIAKTYLDEKLLSDKDKPDNLGPMTYSETTVANKNNMVEIK